jgi:outer membrane protein assembly complex protein YaeT
MMGDRTTYTFIFLILLMGVFAAPIHSQTEPSLWGKPVSSLHLECDAHLKLQDFTGAVTQHEGEALDPAKVSESLKRLYATGRFTELRAEATPEGQGVKLTFVGRAQYFLGVVSAEGSPGPIEATALVTASRLRLGQPLTEEDIAAAQKHLTDLLLANGYYQAHIRHTLNGNPDTEEANLVLSIQAGPASRVSRVDFQSETVFSPQRLMKILTWHPGVHLTATRAEHGLFRLHQFYVAHGYLQVNVNIQQRIYDAASNTEKVVVKTEAGPLIRARVLGASISSARLHELLPMYRDGVIDDQALADSEKLLEDHFQQRGYFMARAKASRESRADPHPHIEITFRMNLGRRGDFAGYGVRGNVAVPTADLLALVAPASQGLIRPAPTYSDDQVERKIAAILALYQSKGFLEAGAKPEIDDHFENANRRFVTFVIQEGARTTVHTLTLTGLDDSTQRKLRPSLVSKPDKPYSPEGMRTDRNMILDYLADHGFVHGSASWHVTPLESTHQVDVEFIISPGVQERIQHVVIVGNNHTRPGIIQRDLKIHAGEPVSQSAFLETQRRLYELGIFNQVQIDPQEEDSSDAEKTVLVGVEEARRWTVGYGGGLEVQRLGSNEPQGSIKASPRLSLDVTRVDVGGRDQTFTMGGRLSNLDTGGNMSYLIPRLLGREDLSLRINGLVDRSREVLTFTADRKEGSVSVEKRMGSGKLLIGRYDFRRVQALDLSTQISAAEIPLLSQPAVVGMLGGSYADDHRDDPADAHRGMYTLVDAGVSWRDFGSQSNFLRFTGQNATYYPLTSHLVFARKTQFGVLSPYGSLYPITVPASNGQPAQVILTDEIPLPERFFMGGSESMRGFSINQAGPRDPSTGYPIGGNALFLNSVELRLAFPQRRIGFAFFEDFGNVYSSVRDMRLFKFSQSSPTDFNYTSHAVGTGVRYKTPVGPIRFDLGYNLNPPQYNVVTGQGTAQSVEVRQLSHVQFFLSIGQSF